jgi:hypothetical protein
MRKWPPILGLQDSLAVTLKYLQTISAVIGLHFYRLAE